MAAAVAAAEAEEHVGGTNRHGGVRASQALRSLSEVAKVNPLLPRYHTQKQYEQPRTQQYQICEAFKIHVIIQFRKYRIWLLKRLYFRKLKFVFYLDHQSDLFPYIQWPPILCTHNKLMYQCDMLSDQGTV
jgi:hypothetical protein